MRVHVGDGLSRLRWKEAPGAERAVAVLGSLVGRKVHLHLGRAGKVVSGELTALKAKTFVVSGSKAGIRYADLGGARLEIVG